MSLASSIDIAAAHRHGEVAVTRAEYQQNRAGHDEQRGQMKRPGESGEIRSKNSPPRLLGRAGAICRPENNAAEQKRDRVNLGLSRTEPDGGHEAGGQSGGGGRESVASPLEEKICQRAASQRRTNRRQQVDRTRKSENGSERHAPHLSEQHVQGRTGWVRDAQRVYRGEELARVPQRDARRKRDHVDEKK